MPSRWELCSPKALFEERRAPNLPDDVHLTPSQKYGVLPQVEYIERTGGSVVLNLTGQNAMKHVEPDDFIIHLRSFQGGLERARQAGKVSAAYTVVKPRASANPGFYRWLLKSRAFVQELQTTTNQLRDGQSIRWTDFVKVPLPAPAADEQRAIAEYLDRETQKIDELIAEQRSLIETLRERRRVVIDDVFLRRATGSRRLRRLLTSSITGPFGTQLKASEYVNDCVPVVNPTHIVDSRIRPDRSITVTNEKSVELERFRIIPGDVILGRKGDVDKAAVVSKVEEGYICGSDSMALRPSGEVNGEYLWWYLQSPSAHRQLEQWSVGSTVAGLNQRTISHLEIPTMDLSGQLEICAYLNTQTSRIDELISESEDLIALSQERRAALITAAVTGQIDVRSVA